MPSLVHGTRQAYRAGCGCTRCKAWKAADTAKYRASKRATAAVPVARKKPAPKAGPTAPIKGAPADRIAGGIERELSDYFTANPPEHGPWVKTLRESALKLARTADEATPELVTRILPQLLSLLERLGLDPGAPPRKVPGSIDPDQSNGAVDDPDDAFVAGLRSAG